METMSQAKGTSISMTKQTFNNMKSSFGFAETLITATLTLVFLLTFLTSYQAIQLLHPSQLFKHISIVEPLNIHNNTRSGQQSVAQKLDMLPDTQVTRVDCAQLMAGNQTEITRAEKLQQTTTPARVNFTSVTSNCTHFRKSRGYIDYAVSQEEEDFPLAFTIVMYKDTEQAERLLRAIYRPQNNYCLHVDKSANITFLEDMNSISSCFSNVDIASHQVAMQWGTISVVDAELSCMADLWYHTRWRYLINLTGQEFPLKTNLDLVRILKTLNGANFIEGSKNKDLYFRTNHVFKNLTKSATRKAPPPHGLRLYIGSMKMAMSREFVDYLLHNQVARDFREWVSDTYIPDETFFSTLNHNPQLGVPGAFTGTKTTSSGLQTGKSKHVLDPFIPRYLVWKGQKSCHGRWVRTVCIFGVGDLESLSQRPEMFVNKFHMDYQPLAYDCMEELHFNRTRQEILGHKPGHLNMTLYENYPYAHQHVGVSDEYPVWSGNNGDV